MNGRALRFKIARIYYADACERGLDIGEAVAESTSWVHVRCSPEQFAELLSDARYQAEHTDGPARIRASARRVVAELLGGAR